MFKKFTTMTAMMFIASLFFSSLALADSRNMDGWGDEPVICTDCDYTAGTRIGTNYESGYPGHIVSLPIVVHVDSSKSVDLIYFQLSAESGVKFYDVDTSGTGWEGDYSVTYEDSTSLILQFFYDSGGQDDLWNVLLAHLKMIISETANFADTFDVTHDNGFPLFSLEDSTENCVDITAVDGYVTTQGDSVWLWVDTTEAFSYQGQDTTDTAKDTLIFIPFYFKAEFPVDTFRVKFVADSLMNVGSIDSFIVNDNYSSITHGEQAHLIQIWDVTTDDEPYPVNTDILIGNLRVPGRDFRSDYTSDNSFTKLDSIERFIPEHTHFGCDSSSQIGSLSTSADGGANYPVYSCSTYIGSDTVNADLSVSIPIWVDHSFWSQKYECHIQYDSTDLHLTSFYDIGGHFPPIEVDTANWSGNNCILQITTDPPSGIYDGLYIHPDSEDTIFILNFEATESFAQSSSNSTSLTFNSGYTNKVLDFFHLFPDANKIVRDIDDTGYFYTSSGTVYMKEIFAVSIDSVDCSGGDTTTIPVRLDWATTNLFDSLWFMVKCPDTSYFKIADYVEEVDFDFGRFNTVISGGGDYMTFNGCISMGDLQGSGIIGEIKCVPGSDSGWADLEWEYCYAWKALSSQGEPQTIAANPQANGGIGECGAAKRNVLDLPKDFAVSQNYPNPFNAHTKIAFNLPMDAHVRIVIYDIMGRQTRSLIDDVFQSGKHIIEWDGKDNTGNTVASGFYFYRFEADEYSTVKKMLMLK